MALREAIGLCDKWATSTALLTTTYWVGTWKSGPFADEVLARLQEQTEVLKDEKCGVYVLQVRRNNLLEKSLQSYRGLPLPFYSL